MEISLLEVQQVLFLAALVESSPLQMEGTALPLAQEPNPQAAIPLPLGKGRTPQPPIPLPLEQESRIVFLIPYPLALMMSIPLALLPLAALPPPAAPLLTAASLSVAHPRPMALLIPELSPPQETSPLMERCRESLYPMEREPPSLAETSRQMRLILAISLRLEPLRMEDYLSPIMATFPLLAASLPMEPTSKTIL